MTELQGKQALITGATGFIGGRLAERLITEVGMKVRGLVRNPQKGQALAELGVEVVPGDLTCPASLLTAVTGCQFIFHGGAWVGEQGNKDQVWAVNVGGTQNLIEAALATGGIERFIHLSSCAVYGSRQQFNIDETMPPRRRGNLYSDSKVAAEAVVLAAYQEHHLPIVLARASQVYGPGSPQFTIRPIQMIKSGKMVLIEGGRHLCKPVYIDNLVDGLALCATIEAAIGEAINLTDGITIPWRDFFGAYGRMLGVETFPSVPFALAWLLGYFNELKAIFTGRKAGFNRDVVRTLHSSNSFSNQKARTLLGWEPRVDFNEGMRRTEAWLKAQGYLEHN
jgi:nucleoside-diphosphate-sugar epimerase